MRGGLDTRMVPVAGGVEVGLQSHPTAQPPRQCCRPPMVLGRTAEVSPARQLPDQGEMTADLNPISSLLAAQPMAKAEWSASPSDLSD
jgi:hypothetical protein